MKSIINHWPVPCEATRLAGQCVVFPRQTSGFHPAWSGFLPNPRLCAGFPHSADHFALWNTTNLLPGPKTRLSNDQKTNGNNHPMCTSMLLLRKPRWLMTRSASASWLAIVICDWIALVTVADVKIIQQQAIPAKLINHSYSDASVGQRTAVQSRVARRYKHHPFVKQTNQWRAWYTMTLIRLLLLIAGCAWNRDGLLIDGSVRTLVGAAWCRHKRIERGPSRLDDFKKHLLLAVHGGLQHFDAARRTLNLKYERFA